MEDCKDCMLSLSSEFKDCQKALIAIGDETRQQIIIALLESEGHGSRVGEITMRTHLSRSAVSHHLQILKNADIIDMRREGTMNYYFIKAADTQWSKILHLVTLVNEIIQTMPAEEKELYNRTE
ncbi:transcriptional regulator [Anaerocolumna cellulosilytica]|uniref:Transcriptional regulator n=2 Tax=Anaerocolumna cellulosilytica TaxID=433286 RepID=A0A6S6R3R8_9FIRM|nr:metalloregulator ArsR/SmtB family transcription factor [Anaerocolumna cellulosilytica]BCJ93771.1 transcriptional regulator [Anaerocolumna cellulosilytica]